MISDLTPNVTEALDVARRIDGPVTNLDVFEIKLQHTSPTALVARLERISQTKKTVQGEKQVGTVLAHPRAGACSSSHRRWSATCGRTSEPVPNLETGVMSVLGFKG